MIGVDTEFWKNVGIVAGSIAAGIGGTRIALRKDRVANADADLDVSSLTAGSRMIQDLQADVSRLRATMVESDAKWRADMTALENRLQSMSATVDASIAARRAAEESCARLRYQLQQLGQTPVA